MTTPRFSATAGAIAQAMAKVQEHREPGADVSGRIPCPRCGSQLRFTIQANGISRGQCAAAGCLRWSS